MNTIEITGAQLAEARQMLLQKQTRLEFSTTILEIRLKQAALKLQDLVKIYSLYTFEFDRMTEALAESLEDNGLREELQTRHHQYASKVFTLKRQIDILVVKVVFDLPLALALENAQLTTIRQFLKDDSPKFFNAEAA